MAKRPARRPTAQALFGQRVVGRVERSDPQCQDDTEEERDDASRRRAFNPSSGARTGTMSGQEEKAGQHR